MSNWNTICQLNDLIPFSGVAAKVNGEQVAIFYLPGQAQEIYAIGNYDPIGNAYVMSRGIITETDGEFYVASPLYKEHYHLASGQCLEKEAYCLPCWEVKLEGEHVLLKKAKDGFIPVKVSA